jgi:hypothetical protein
MLGEEQDQVFSYMARLGATTKHQSEHQVNIRFDSHFLSIFLGGNSSYTTVCFLLFFLSMIYIFWTWETMACGILVVYSVGVVVARWELW